MNDDIIDVRITLMLQLLMVLITYLLLAIPIRINKLNLSN